MVLEDLLTNFETFSLAKQASGQGPQGEAKFLIGIASEAPGANPAVVNQFGYLASEEERPTAIRNELMTEIKDDSENGTYSTLRGNLSEVLGDIGEEGCIGIGIQYSNEAKPVRDKMKILKDRNVSDAYRETLLEDGENDSDKDKTRTKYYNKIVSGFDADGLLAAFKGIVGQAQTRYIESHFYSNTEDNSIPRYSQDIANTYLGEVLSDDNIFREAGMPIASLYHQKHKGSEE